MGWFKKKRGKYWYYVQREDGKERHYYIGADQDILARLRGTNKQPGPQVKSKDSKPSRRESKIDVCQGRAAAGDPVRPTKKRHRTAIKLRY